MGLSGLSEVEPTTRLELVTYRLRIAKGGLIINGLQGCCVGVALGVGFLAFLAAPVGVHAAAVDVDKAGVDAEAAGEDFFGADLFG